VPNPGQEDSNGNGVGDACEEQPPGREDECDEDADCDDGDLCTVDRCVEGDCVITPVECGEDESCDPDTGDCVPDEQPPTQPVPPPGCGIFNGIALICLPLTMLLWVGLRLAARRRDR
jgi:hypothetical protein